MVTLDLMWNKMQLELWAPIVSAMTYAIDVVIMNDAIDVEIRSDARDFVIMADARDI